MPQPQTGIITLSQIYRTGAQTVNIYRSILNFIYPTELIYLIPWPAVALSGFFFRSLAAFRDAAPFLGKHKLINILLTQKQNVQLDAAYHNGFKYNKNILQIE